MARYSKSASSDVKSAMKRRKAGTLKSGGSRKTVKSKKQAIAIGLSEAREKGKKVRARNRREAWGQKPVILLENIKRLAEKAYRLEAA